MLITVPVHISGSINQSQLVVSVVTMVATVVVTILNNTSIIFLTLYFDTVIRQLSL